MKLVHIIRGRRRLGGLAISGSELLNGPGAVAECRRIEEEEEDFICNFSNLMGILFCTSVFPYFIPQI